MNLLNSFNLRLGLAGIFLILFCNTSSGQQEPTDPFLPYLDGKAPRIIKDFGEEMQDSVKIRKLVFHSRDVKTSEGIVPSQIFAVIVRPAKKGNYPAILLLHGGGGYAETDRAVFWAAQGYIVLVLDEPGIANPEKVNAESTGPWKKSIYGKSFFTASPDVTASSIFDGVLASIQGLYLLKDQPDVLKDRIGVDGISWGGYATTMVTSLAGKYICASFSVFGSGFYDEGSTFIKNLDKMPASEKMLWLKYLDAGRRAGRIKTPFFIAGAANDAFFYPPAVMKTLLAMKKAPVNQLFGPNASHKILLPGGGGTDKATVHPGWLSMEQIYFDYFLKDKGFPLPVVTASKQVASKSGDKKIQVKFRVKATVAIAEAKVYYSLANAEWPKRLWVPVTARVVKDGWYVAELPEEVSGKALDWYANVSDLRPVSASGFIVRCK